MVADTVVLAVPIRMIFFGCFSAAVVALVLVAAEEVLTWMILEMMTILGK